VCCPFHPQSPSHLIPPVTRGGQPQAYFLSEKESLYRERGVVNAMTESATTWIGTVVIDCKNWEEMINFWKEALGYEFKRRPDAFPGNDWALIADPTGHGPNLAFQKDPDGPGKVYWFHFDLFSAKPASEVQRLLGLGATMLLPAREGFDYVTLADPDGNPFDVLTEVINREPSS
jgi:catechol 2,3-dioxygenase-like lactoylglutathione lyase family enzyme